jgi:integrase
MRIVSVIALKTRSNSRRQDYFLWNKPSACTHPDVLGKKAACTHQQHQGDAIGKKLRKVYDRAGITPRGAHRLRDTFRLEFLNSGGKIEHLTMLLGHNTTATTEKHYMPWVKSRQAILDFAVEQSLAIHLPTGGAVAEPTSRQ